MTITDNEVTKLLSHTNSPDLDELVETYPEEEREGRSDIQILADELSWILYCYTDDGHSFHGELTEARKWLRETHGGKQFKGLITSKELKHLKIKTQLARDVVNEYNRLKSLMAKLNKQGVYGQWL